MYYHALLLNRLQTDFTPFDVYAYNNVFVLVILRFLRMFLKFAGQAQLHNICKM